MNVQIVISISDRLVEYVRDKHLAVFGRYPSEEMLRDFFCSDVEGYYNDQPMSQELEDAIVSFFYVEA